MQRTLKYKLLLGLFRLSPAKKMMAAPPTTTQKLFKMAYIGENIPAMSDPALKITIGKVKGSAVVYYKHPKPCDKLAIYHVGGGLLKYPQPDQARSLIGLAKECNMNILLPYFPIIFTGGTLPDDYAMVYELYKRALKKYKPENICFVGGSSGGNLARGIQALY